MVYSPCMDLVLHGWCSDFSILIIVRQEITVFMINLHASLFRPKTWRISIDVSYSSLWLIQWATTSQTESLHSSKVVVSMQPYCVPHSWIWCLLWGPWSRLSCYMFMARSETVPVISTERGWSKCAKDTLNKHQFLMSVCLTRKRMICGNFDKSLPPQYFRKSDDTDNCDFQYRGILIIPIYCRALAGLSAVDDLITWCLLFQLVQFQRTKLNSCLVA